MQKKQKKLETLQKEFNFDKDIQIKGSSDYM